MATFIYISVAFSKQIVRKIQSSCLILIFEKQESRKINKITIITILKNSIPKTWDNVSFGDSSCSHRTILLKLPGTLTITEECNQINSCFSQTFQIFSPCLTISFGVTACVSLNVATSYSPTGRKISKIRILKYYSKRKTKECNESNLCFLEGFWMFIPTATTYFLKDFELLIPNCLTRYILKVIALTLMKVVTIRHRGKKPFKNQHF